MDGWINGISRTDLIEKAPSQGPSSTLYSYHIKLHSNKNNGVILLRLSGIGKSDVIDSRYLPEW